RGTARRERRRRSSPVPLTGSTKEDRQLFCPQTIFCCLRRKVACPRFSWLSKQRINEGFRLKGLEIFYTFADPDVAHRQSELTGHRQDDAALGRPIQLGQYHAGDTKRLVELTRLRQPVLADGRVQD